MNILEENKTNLLIGAVATGTLYALNAIDSKALIPYFIGTSLISHVVRMGMDGNSYVKPSTEAYPLDPYISHHNQHDKYKCKYGNRFPNHDGSVCRSNAIIHV